MKRKTALLPILMFGLYLGSAIAAPPEASAWQPLKGANLHSAFANMELGDDVHFAYRFRADGSFEGTEMAKHISGTWRTTAKEFCWHLTQPPDEEECHTIQRNGHDIRAFRNGVEVWSGTLAPLHD